MNQYILWTDNVSFIPRMYKLLEGKSEKGKSCSVEFANHLEKNETAFDCVRFSYPTDRWVKAGSVILSYEDTPALMLEACKRYELSWVSSAKEVRDLMVKIKGMSFPTA